MSTPLSRRNKLDGLALYAPRRMREQAAYEPPADPPVPQDEPADEQIPIAAEPIEGGDRETAFAEQRIEEAIRKIVALGQSDEPAMPSATHAQPTLAPRDDDDRHDDEDYEPRSPSFIAHDDAEQVGPRIRRRSRLEAEIVPEPPVGEGRSIAPLLIRLSSAMMFAAVVAYGMTMFASRQSGPPPEDAANNQAADASYQAGSAAPNAQQAQPEPQSPPPHLIVEDQQAFANEPLSLIVLVQHPQQNASLLFDGLAQGTTLSAGAPAGASSWQVPYNQSQGLYLNAPKDFTGVMNAAVSLIGADKELLDTQAVQLKWTARAPKPLPDPAPAPAPQAAQLAPAAKPVIVATAGDPSNAGALKTITNPGTAGTLKTVAIKPIDPGEAAMLMQRGRDFLGAGDLSAARVAFSRLADAGIADAALQLANTYDPTYLATHHVMGVQGDRAMARSLYQRAKELGSTEAAQILARMTGK